MTRAARGSASTPDTSSVLDFLEQVLAAVDSAREGLEEWRPVQGAVGVTCVGKRAGGRVERVARSRDLVVLQPEVEAAYEASLLAEKDASITDDAFDVVDGAYLALRRRLEALEAMQVTAMECCDQLGSVADAARVAGV